jgi:hypothetical protein
VQYQCISRWCVGWRHPASAACTTSAWRRCLACVLLQPACRPVPKLVWISPLASTFPFKASPRPAPAHCFTLCWSAEKRRATHPPTARHTQPITFPPPRAGGFSGACVFQALCSCVFTRCVRWCLVVSSRPAHPAQPCRPAPVLVASMLLGLRRRRKGSKHCVSRLWASAEPQKSGSRSWLASRC